MLYLATDHAGYELKNKIATFLKAKGIEYVDMGPYCYNSDDDYPDFIIPAVEKVGENPENHNALILGGSGQGEAIAANKVTGVRAAVYYGGPTDIITLSKVHNNANVLSLGARFIDEDKIFEAISLWLNTDFLHEERHQRRINKISNYETH